MRLQPCRWSLALLVMACACRAPQPTWRNLGPGGGGWIQSICASPHDPAELFIATVP